MFYSTSQMAGSCYLYLKLCHVLHAISKMAAGCLLSYYLCIFIVVPSVLCHVQDGGWVLAIFLFIVVPRVLCHVQNSGWVLAIYGSWVVVNLLFIFIVVPCDACNFQDGRWVLTKVTFYIYSCAICCMSCPRWRLGAYYLYL